MRFCWSGTSFLEPFSHRRSMTARAYGAAGALQAVRVECTAFSVHPPFSSFLRFEFGASVLFVSCCPFDGLHQNENGHKLRAGSRAYPLGDDADRSTPAPAMYIVLSRRSL